MEKTEKEIEKEILDWLELRNFLVFKHDPNDAYTGRRLSRHRISGVSDILGLLKNGTFLAIEVKTETGKLSEKQFEFINTINETGGVAFVARSTMDVENEFRARGISL